MPSELHNELIDRINDINRNQSLDFATQNKVKSFACGLSLLGLISVVYNVRVVTLLLSKLTI